MQLSVGIYGPFNYPFWTIRNNQLYTAHVEIYQDEYKRLKLAEWEDYDQVTPFVTWLHTEIGLWGEKWISQSTLRSTNVYFTRQEDAMHFLLRWSA